jgi:hypothetical protein
MKYNVIIIYNDFPNEKAIIKCESYNDAINVKQAFINYGKCKLVEIERISK